MKFTLELESDILEKNEMEKLNNKAEDVDIIESDFKIFQFSQKHLEMNVFFQIIMMQNSLYIWIGTIQGNISQLGVSMLTKFVKTITFFLFHKTNFPSKNVKGNDAHHMQLLGGSTQSFENEISKHLGNKKIFLE